MNRNDCVDVFLCLFEVITSMFNDDDDYEGFSIVFSLIICFFFLQNLYIHNSFQERKHKGSIHTIQSALSLPRSLLLRFLI